MKHKRILGYSAIGLTLIAIGVAFVRPISSSNLLLRARAETVSSGTVTFSNCTKSGTTTTSYGTTSKGARLVCKVFNNDSSVTTSNVAALKNGSIIRFYESDGATEFTFEDIDIIRINKDNANFGFIAHYVYDTGVGGQFSYSSKTDSYRQVNFSGSSYGNVTNLWIECNTDNSDVAKVSSIVLTYNCTTKYQTGLEISTIPSKTSYTEGESFDTSGMVVKAVYSNEQKIATRLYSVSPSGALSSSDTFVTISFGGFSATQPITVAAIPHIVSIFVDTPPTKTTYTEGESFNTAGMVVKANYDNSTTAVINDYTYSPSGALTTSDTEITISYQGFNTTQAITVNAGGDTFDETATYSMTTNYSSTDYTLTVDFQNKLHTMVAGNQTYRIHFTYEIDGSNITFTADKKSGDSDYSEFFRYRIFFNSSDNVNTTGTIADNKLGFSLTLYRDFAGKKVTGTYNFTIDE